MKEILDWWKDAKYKQYIKMTDVPQEYQKSFKTFMFGATCEKDKKQMNYYIILGM